MAASTAKKNTPAKASAKAPSTPNPVRAARMAKGYGRESLAAALGWRMADVYSVEHAPATDSRVAGLLALIKGLEANGNPLQERALPVNKPVRTKTAAQIKADAEARNAHPVTVARKAQGYTREGLAQALKISTTALWHLEQSTGKEQVEAVKAIKALPKTAASTPAKAPAKAPAKTAKAPAKAKQVTADSLI